MFSEPAEGRAPLFPSPKITLVRPSSSIRVVYAFEPVDRSIDLLVVGRASREVFSGSGTVSMATRLIFFIGILFFRLTFIEGLSRAIAYWLSH